MANEINIQAALTFQRFSPAVLLGSGAKDITQTGKEASCATQSLTSTSAVPVEVGNVPAASVGFLFIKNLNPDTDTKTVNVLSSGTAFAKLKAGQFCLAPINSVVSATNITVQGSAGTGSGAAAIDLLAVAVAE
jgi:hypothetical protein